MPKIARALAVLALALAGPLAAPSAQAQPARVFVGAQGSDANPCTFALPCRTFQHAHDTVTAGGEIDVLDPAGYGAVTISKSISIQGHGFSGITATSGNAISISAGANDEINLRGLIIEGAGAGAQGIEFTSGKALTVEDCVIRNLTSFGIRFAPTTNSSLAVSNTFIARTNTGARLVPNANALTLKAVFSRVEVHNNGSYGIQVDGSGVTGGTLNVAAVDSVASNNVQDGLFVG